MTRWLWAALVLAVAAAGVQSWRLERLRTAWASDRATAAEVASMQLRQAQAQVAAARAALAEAKEAENALPNGDACGLDAGRVRLLPSR